MSGAMKKARGICAGVLQPNRMKLFFVLLVVTAIIAYSSVWSRKSLTGSKTVPGSSEHGDAYYQKATVNLKSIFVSGTKTASESSDQKATTNLKNKPSTVIDTIQTTTVNPAKRFATDEEIATEEELVHLAVKLARSIEQTQSYEDSRALDSAFFEVMEMVDKLTDARTKHTPDSCIERTNETTCEQSIRFVVTIVASFVHNSNASHIEWFLHSCRTWYPDVKVIVGVPESSLVTTKDYPIFDVQKFAPSTSETDVWNYLLSTVTTRYVYISRDVLKFNEYTRLESLVNSLTKTMAVAVSSSTKYLHTGQWSNGCLQTIYQNYQLKYRHGYHVSLNSCLVCHYLSAPFITYTHLITKLRPLQKGMTGTSGFSIWFLGLLQTNRVVLSCPDSMVYVSKNMELSTQHNEWLDLAKYHKAEVVHLPDGTHLSFGCDEVDTQCISNHPPGMAKSLCCLRALGEGVKLVMRECQAAGLFCEMTDGTILGTLKFEKSLPWEIDADLEIETNNVSTFNKVIVPKISKLGYKTRDYTKYETIHPSLSGWTIELFPIGSLGSTRLKSSGVSVTQVLLDGEYVSTCESPGLLGRNRYGHEIYQHVNHWRQTGAKSSWMFYKPGKFNKCTKPGHQACLEQFRADGSTQFNIDGIEP